MGWRFVFLSLFYVPVRIFQFRVVVEIRRYTCFAVRLCKYNTSASIHDVYIAVRIFSAIQFSCQLMW